ncbi:putative queuine tRNAribosyltransferase [Monocercomonoides exilis]|uniref:putative queuine tRNAribosyltransferase n=1 Tax=Monocercomonoides exilis TaxID=2049356 RepID=UPI0035593EA6|nr:putative queuine tRNAribosyltransferase [Monocercomonoides exilis]|eukprot:MONOS_13011.1-p1 / transcript=MONOS_13011.1 / gene=MONOS_13011 / organism=Monocercomonoides_exilis_PA203 / gene_product=queuine tRNAribosyltransferase / transcript_product=queuine tRNAribosyltransferase / location=Mono_scaffold00766:12792-14558(+) / protein_length=534 / sequence_SO=supercontig / SO=protein_coding / is_pseudo=false
MFKIHETWKKARCSTLTLHHGPCRTPMFMPVGTQGAMKGITTSQMLELDVDLMLSNTYWMSLRPGPEEVATFGGLHGLMSWPRNILTDSGGFQMVSLIDLSTVTEEGVTFTSPLDGKEMMLRPEDSIHNQNELGADIIMALDDVVPSVMTGPRVKEAMQRTIRWLDRCIAAHKRPNDQCLFAIVQGSLDVELRKDCVNEFLKRDASIPGYAIGGLSGGEEKDTFIAVVDAVCSLLPPQKPRYVMGVGYPVDIVCCVCVGADMFDCVYPCRTARFGTALADVPGGVVSLRSEKFTNDATPMDKSCNCYVCRGGISRARLHQMLKGEKEGGVELISYHNIAYMMNLMSRLRQSIRDNTLPAFAKYYMRTLFPRRIDLPSFVNIAFRLADIDEDFASNGYPADEELIVDDSVFLSILQTDCKDIPIRCPYHVEERNIHGVSRIKKGEVEDDSSPSSKQIKQIEKKAKSSQKDKNIREGWAKKELIKQQMREQKEKKKQQRADAPVIQMGTSFARLVDFNPETGDSQKRQCLDSEGNK